MMKEYESKINKNVLFGGGSWGNIAWIELQPPQASH